MATAYHRFFLFMCLLKCLIMYCIVAQFKSSLLIYFWVLCYYFEKPPMASMRQGPNIRKTLCRSRLAKVSRAKNLKRNAHLSAPGWKKCSRPCPACPFTLPSCKTVKSQVSDYEHTIKTPVNCQSQNVVYYWECTKDNCSEFPRCEYIGLSSRTLQKRLYEHHYYVRSDKLTEPSGEHFNLPGHAYSDLKGLVLEKVRSSDPFVLMAREALLIEKFDTFSKGLNKEPWFFKQYQSTK